MRPKAEESGLAALRIAAGILGISVDTQELRRKIGLRHAAATLRDIHLAARAAGLKSQLRLNLPQREIASLSRPAILSMTDGRFTVFRKLDDGSDAIRYPNARGPARLTLSEIAERWSGDAIVISAGRPSDGRSPAFGISWFIQAGWRYRRPIGHILLASFIIQILGILTPLFFQVIVDKVLVYKTIDTLEIVCAAMTGCAFLEASMNFARSYLVAHTSSRLDVELGSRLFAKLFELPVSYFETRPAGQTIARVRELENIRSFLTGQGLTSVIDLTFAFVASACLFAYSAVLALTVIGTFPIYLIIVSVLRPALRTSVNERFFRGARSQQYLVESVIGSQTIKSGAIEGYALNEWEERLAEYARSSYQASVLGGAGQSLIQMVSRLTTVVVIYFGANEVFDTTLTVGQLVAFNMISSQLIAPLLRLSSLGQDFQQIQISIDKIGDIFRAAPEEEPGTPGNFGIIRGDIAFNDVSFRYSPDAPAVLNGVQLKIPAGQVVGIVGPSGSGKSTLTKLIQKMYRPEVGSITVDDIDLSHAASSWLRKQVGVVLQDNLLFNRTIHENIAIFEPTAPREKIIESARLSGAHEFISAMPYGYDTRIEERGANLSGGQRQRIAIARALVRDPRILLFDEATSALDYESERMIQLNMREITHGRTVIIIAHRLAAVVGCDRIIGIEDGRVVEDGTHQELLATEGLYARLWALQGAKHV